MEKAKVVYKQGKMTPNGREAIMELRKGEKGAGKKLSSVVYWPWSNPSCEAADRAMVSVAEQQGVELNWGEG